MDTKQAILASLDQADFVVNAYLSDLKQEDLFVRPVPGANHLAWQWGHLISSDQYLLNKVIANAALTALPAGFAEKHKKAAATIDDPNAFCSKEEYLRLGQQVRAETRKIVQGLSPESLDQPTSGGLPPPCKTTALTLLFIPTHWLMHAGQWAVIRRKLGRPPLF